MDFFARQEVSRRLSRALVGVFLLAFVLVALATTIVVTAALRLYTENKVAFARQAFNDAVLGYNNACQNFPGNLIANNFGFKTAQFLEIEQAEKRAVPKVSFS